MDHLQRTALRRRSAGEGRWRRCGEGDESMRYLVNAIVCTILGDFEAHLIESFLAFTCLFVCSASAPSD